MSSSQPPWQYHWKRPEIHPVIWDDSFPNSTKDENDDTHVYSQREPSRENQSRHLSPSEQEQLLHMTPIQCTSARLTPMETKLILQTLGRVSSSSSEDHKILDPFSDCIITLTILSSSSTTTALVKDDRCVSMTTSKRNTMMSPMIPKLFREPADVLLMEVTVCESSDVPVHEVRQNDPSLDSFIENGENGMTTASNTTYLPSNTRIRTIGSKMMRWPSAILYNEHPHDSWDSSPLQHDENRSKNSTMMMDVFPSEECSHEMRQDVHDVGTTSCATGGLPTEDHVVQREPQSQETPVSIWQSVGQKIFRHHRWERQNDPRAQQQQRQNHRKEHHQQHKQGVISRKRRHGLIGIALCRQPDQNQEEDKKENALEALDLMTFGMERHLMDIDTPLVESVKGTDCIQTDLFSKYHAPKPKRKSADTSTVLPIDKDDGIELEENDTEMCIRKSTSDDSCTDQKNVGDLSTVESHNNELLLSCICNHGKLYFFSVLDLLGVKRIDNDACDNPTKDQGNIVKVSDQEDLISSSFATIFFGSKLQAKLNDTILPLNNPKIMLQPSLLLRVENQLNMLEITDEKSVNLDWTTDPITNKIIDQPKYHYSEPHSYGRRENANFKSPNMFLDLSLFDSTIEPSSARFRTFKNTATICASVFEFVVIGGKGIRNLRHHKSSTNHTVENAQASANTTSTSDKGSYIHQAQKQVECHNITRPEETTARAEKSFDLGGFISIVSLQHFSEVKTFSFLSSRRK